MTTEEFTSTKTIFPLLSNYWYPHATHLKIVGKHLYFSHSCTNTLPVMKLSGLPAQKSILIEFHPVVEAILPSRTTQRVDVMPTTTSAKTASQNAQTSQIEAFWGETILVRNIKKHKQKVKLTVTCLEAGTSSRVVCVLPPDFVLTVFSVGEISINALKLFQESINNGQRCIDKEFLFKNKDKSQKIALSLRFVAI